MSAVGPVTCAAAGACGLLMSYFNFKVASTRNNTKQFYGPLKTGAADQEAQFTYNQRAHQNATEHVPIFLIILSGLESNKVFTEPLLKAYAAAFVIARVAHSLHLSTPKRYPRVFRVGGYLTQFGLSTLGAGALAYWAIKTLTQQWL